MLRLNGERAGGVGCGVQVCVCVKTDLAAAWLTRVVPSPHCCAADVGDIGDSGGIPRDARDACGGGVRYCICGDECPARGMTPRVGDAGRWGERRPGAAGGQQGKEAHRGAWPLSGARAAADSVGYPSTGCAFCQLLAGKTLFPQGMAAVLKVLHRCT